MTTPDTTTTEGKIAVMQSGGPWQKAPRQGCFGESAWMNDPNPVWDWDNYSYQTKPKEPREMWVNVYSNRKCLHETKEIAEENADSNRIECIHYLEVIE
jgi:hypothetical protein